MKLKNVAFLVTGLLISVTINAQLSKDIYQQADSASRFSQLVYNTVSSVNWVENSQSFWYKVRTQKGTEYKMVDAVKLKSKEAFDHEKLCKAINEAAKKEFKPYALNLRALKFIDDGKNISFEMDQASWQCDLRSYKLEKKSDVKRNRNNYYWGNSDDESDEKGTESPDGNWEAFVRNQNLFIRDKKSDEEFQVSFDGTPGDYYSSRGIWSPDSKKFAVNKIRKNEKRFIYFVESSPDSQLQPILEKREYLKPGDLLPINKPCLFDIDSKSQIEVDTKPFENQFSISRLKWWPDSRAFTFEFNQRGHQVYQLVEVNASTGDVEILIEEKSNTFIDYSGKHFRQDVTESDEIIWASERDGWNHLYLIDSKTGKVKNQITKGEWVVRSVVKVDEKERQIIFKGSGKNSDEDPYFNHYYMVDFDGSGLVDLTPEKFEHSAVFSDDYSYFTDTYSSITTPPITVLRRTSDAKTLMNLETSDISELLAQNWKVPEVFVAKARDGKTDIWGNIYYPSNFDPTKKYPVIESIYAGPHGSFVQKSFRPFMYSISGLSELGFIVVSIDGMGTSNRSKAFQDVCFQNLKDAGFPDRILWMQAAAETRPFMDLTRVGLYGTSAGGQSALAGLLFHPEFYKAGVSSCGCHDNRMDKMWWNEQWMGYPVGKHYEECSNVVNAHKLEGKLLLIVGEVDDNVDPASTMQVADALIKADKDFELVVIPGSNHTSGGKYGERKRRDFFVRALLNENTPEWNANTED